MQFQCDGRHARNGIKKQFCISAVCVYYQVYLFENTASQENIYNWEYNRSSQTLKALMAPRRYMQ